MTYEQPAVPLRMSYDSSTTAAEKLIGPNAGTQINMPPEVGPFPAGGVPAISCADSQASYG